MRARSGLIVFSAGLAVLIGSSAHAEPLSLDDARARADEHSPDVRTAQARIEQGRGRRTVAGYALPANPRIDLGVRTDVLFGDQGEHALDVGIEQELEIFGQRGLRISVADAELAVLRLELATARLRVEALVKIAYFDLMFEERHVVAASVIVDQTARLEEVARRRSAAGDVAAAEHELIAADLVVARAELRKAGADRVAAQARLNVLVGRGVGAATSTIGDFPVLAAAAPQDQLLRRAIERRVDLRAAERQVSARGADLALRQRERYPNPTLSIGYSRDRVVLGGDDFMPPGVVAGAAETGQFLGVSLSVPLPFFRRGSGEVQEARGLRAEAEAARDATTAAIGADVAAAHAHYEEARQRALDYAGLETRLTATLALYEKAYSGGRIGVTEFLAVRDRVLRTNLAALEARHDAAVAGAELELAVGGHYTEGSR